LNALKASRFQKEEMNLDRALFKSHKIYFFISPLGGDDSKQAEIVHHKTGTKDNPSKPP